MVALHNIAANVGVGERVRMFAAFYIGIQADAFKSELGGIWVLFPFPSYLATFFLPFSLSFMGGVIVINAACAANDFYTGAAAIRIYKISKIIERGSVRVQKNVRG